MTVGRPCKVCGTPIPPTGRRGRPATICADCKDARPAPTGPRQSRTVLDGAGVECRDCGETTHVEAPFDDVARRMALVRHRSTRACV